MIPSALIKKKLILLATVVCCAIPFLYIIYLVNRYAVDVPYWDDWSHAPMIDHFLHGNMQWPELWAQHNEHRLLTFRIARLFFVWTSHWNLIYEMYFSLALTVLIFLILAWLVSFTHRSFEVTSYAWLLVFIALLNWSPTQWENFLWAHQLSFFLQNTFALLSIVFLTVGIPSASKVILAALCAALSTYSSGAGLVLWPLGLVSLLILNIDRVFIPTRQGRKTLLIWICAAFSVLLAYFWSYKKPSYHPELCHALYHPLEMVFYLCDYVGSVFACHHAKLSSIIGGLGVLCWTFIIMRFAGKTRITSNLARQCLPWFTIGNYALLAGFITGVARLGFGIEQSLSSRYITVSILFWVSLAAIINILTLNNGGIGLRKTLFNCGYSYAKTLAIFVLAFILLISGFLSIPEWKAKHEILETAQNALLLGRNDQIGKLYPDVDHVLKMNQFLRKEHLSFYNKQLNNP